MEQKKPLTEDELRLTAAYLNISDKGKALLDTVAEKLAMSNYELTMEEQREQREESE